MIRLMGLEEGKEKGNGNGTHTESSQAESRGRIVESPAHRIFNSLLGRPE